MSDPVVGILLGAAVLAPVIISLVAFAFAAHNGSGHAVKIQHQKLTLRQTCIFGALWLIAAMLFVGTAFIGKAHFQGKEFLAWYLGCGGVVLALSLWLLAHAMFYFVLEKKRYARR